VIEKLTRGVISMTPVNTVPTILVVASALLLWVQPANGWPQEFLATDVSNFPMEEIARAWGLNPRHASTYWSHTGVLGVQLIACSSPAGIAWPGEVPTYTFQFTSLTDQAVSARGQVRVVQYELLTVGDDVFHLGMRRLADCGTVPIGVAVAPRGWADVTVAPPLPERKGGYALIIELDGQDALFGAGTVRTFQPQVEPRQFYRLTMDMGEPAVLSRLGVTVNRVGFGFKPLSDPDFEAWFERQCAPLRRLREARLPVCVEFGGGDFSHPAQPLGCPRPWLNDQGEMLDTKFDLAWLPKYDPDIKAIAKRVALEFGWPKGPVNAFKLWNEPWNGISISGWGADDERYREIWGAICEGVEEARAEGGVQVLLGGCDSSSNTFDKLFADGRDTWLQRLDFLSIHYQGNNPCSTVKLWRDRRRPDGTPSPVRVWDTESWVANSDDRVAGVLASMFAFGQDRVVGIQGDSVLAAIRDLTVQTAAGPEPRRINHTWSVGAAVGAFQHFVGERPFRELLFRPGLPHAMLFTGDAADDATVVVLGDQGPLFGYTNTALRTARSLAEAQEKADRRARLDALPADSPERADLVRQIEAPQPLRDCRLTLSADRRYALFDFYGNPLPAAEDRLVVPLDARGFYLRADGSPGSGATLVAAVRSGRIEGIAPTTLQLVDATAPIGQGAAFRLRLTNVLNRPVTATVSATVEGLRLGPVAPVAIAPGASVEVPMKVRDGTVRPDNRYPARVRVDCGPDGVVEHREDLRVNLIARATVAVDGALDDWTGALPQPIEFAGQQAATLTEKAWLPFMPVDASVKQGSAVVWLAGDDACFYVAARIHDTTPHPGAPRFADPRHWDDYFYPEVSYGPAGRQEHRWPEGVRRFSYRRDPVLPCGSVPNLDNLQIAFNVLPPEAKKEYPAPPGTYPGFINVDTSDYEFALNPVAERWGGGTEVWRLRRPDIAHKHFYPRQPAGPGDGPVPGARLVVRHTGATRVVECSIPWDEMPEVRDAMRAGRPVKFTCRVNDSAGVGCMELARGRSASKRGVALYPDWMEHWENQLEFGWAE